MANPSETSQPQLFIIKETPGAGRGAFATQDIKAGGTILIADDLNAHILLREYRGEVCWECFAYDRGRKLPVRDALRGFAFCTTECETQWMERQDEVCLGAWEAVESLLKGGGNSKEPIFKALKPTATEVDKRWKAAEKSAAAILRFRLTSRLKGTLGKATVDSGSQAFKEALSKPRSADSLNFQLRALLARYNHPERWSDILLLTEEPCPYWDQSELERDIRAYLHLVCILPEPLLPLAIPETLRTVKTREVHNSFGIRSLEDEGSEFFGFGVWPSASYFNHSCDPNVTKNRVGRTWVFTATADVTAGDELSISYLGGDESLSRPDRQERLKKVWGFECACPRCNVGQ
ncbi:hypothetical protein VSDG_08905 [Cytospora chrysosperma]|uniref:SET domain-containing protein n=1 Tax=Cytospora chrysosperma TaxID=252740 RepID=A0A423VD38_CYTCH|nr:hypothetical protein VSDG_08905 [Valsa sordida]